MHREDFSEGAIPFLATCQLEGNIGDITNEEATKDVTSTVKKASQDSIEYEASTGVAHLTEGTTITSTGHILCRPLQILSRRHGLVLASLSPLFFSIEHLFVAVLNETLDAFQVVFMHVPVLMICSLVLMIYKGVRPPRDYKHYLLLLATGSFQAIAVCFIALSLKTLAVGDTVTITRTCVIQVSFLSWCFLKEPLRILDTLFALLAFGGVIFIARPPFIFRNILGLSSSDVTFHGIFFALAASFGIAMYTVFSRKLFRLGVSSLFCLFFNVTATVILSGLFTLIFSRWRCPTMLEWLFSLLAGVTYALAIATMFYALRVETATLVSILSTLQIFFAFLWQVIFLHLPPFWTSYIGAFLIFVACIAIPVMNKPPPSAPDHLSVMDAEDDRAT